MYVGTASFDWLTVVSVIIVGSSSTTLCCDVLDTYLNKRTCCYRLTEDCVWLEMFFFSTIQQDSSFLNKLFAYRFVRQNNQFLSDEVELEQS